MAAKDVITRFKLETTQYDSKIKEAARELSAYSKTATQAKEGFNQFTKANVEAAKALGTMATSTTNVKDRTKELVSAFNDAAKAYNSLTKEQKQSDFAKALSGSLTQLQQRIKETKLEMQGIGDGMKGEAKGGILAGLGGKMSGALSVFAGNMMTKAAGAVMELGSEIADCVKQGIEMAKAGEGIRNAFEKLGRGDILDGLREATHGTVTDIELMKAAVKFNDFKLPLDELGTMLAFAQQKAKDTGQSVDYMVDSIVTGLGRKSLMILDNLGLSANEIKEKMKGTGDMTKAVGAIIREQMQKAGDYVETAADRAAQANVNLQNKMEELGRKFGPVEEASNQLWTSMKIGILDVVGGPLARLLNGLTEAGRLKNMLNDLSGGGNGERSHTDKVLGILRHYSGGGRGIEGKRDLYNRQVSLYIKNEEKAWREANRLREDLKALRKRQKGSGFAGNIQPLINDTSRRLEAAENRAKAFQILRADYEAGAKEIFSPSKPFITSDNKGQGGTTTHKATRKTGGKGKPTPPPPEGSIEAQRLEVQKLEKAWNRAATDALRDKYLSALKDARKELDRMTGKTPLEGSIDAQAKKVSELQAAWKAAADDGSRKRISAQIAEAEQRLDEMMGKVEQAQGISITNQSGMNEYINMLEQQLSKADYGSAIYKTISAQLTDMKTLQTLVGESLKLGLGTAMFDVADELGMDFWTRAMEGGVENIDWQTIVDKLNDRRKKMGLDPQTFDYDAGTFSNKDNSKKSGLAQADKMVSGLASVSSGLQQMGIQLPDGVTKLLGAAQGLMTIIQAVNSVITLFSTTTATAQVTAETANTAAMGGLIAAVEGLQMTMVAKSFIPGLFANGGIVGHAAGGYFVPGNSYSGDNIPIMANAGEVVLNRAQTGVLASALSEQSAPATSTPYVSGEKIYLGMENYLKRIGRGEIVTSRH